MILYQAEVSNPGVGPVTRSDIKTPGLYSLSHRSAGESRGASSARGHSSSHGFSWILIRRGVEGYMGDADSYAWRRRHRTEAAAPSHIGRGALRTTIT